MGLIRGWSHVPKKSGTYEEKFTDTSGHVKLEMPTQSGGHTCMT